MSELDDTDDESVVNVEAVLLDGGGVMRFESGNNLKKLILADMVQSVGTIRFQLYATNYLERIFIRLSVGRELIYKLWT